MITTEAPELKTRRYTVGYIRDWKTPNKATSSITLKGIWLDEADFETGTPLKVRVMPDCLVLTAEEPLPPPPLEPEIMQTLRKVCKFSARRQKQVTELIEVIGKTQR
ncbi:type I addiction module toxin, SymE family [Enterobacter sp. Ap-1006]|uniref:SymE family type I addiction module toxin n=1 Tax=Enterobacter sp. Ap-1006 TaxID=2608345 RepID=UPI0014227B6A|nr:SymE family type I addiction module toxin [Enterobacter sp. Ap-1006]NIF47133.1 type I addiction module toxin, SymE family [Enterobacter sp. Ap-1006]